MMILYVENFDMLFSGNKYNITWKTIFIYYIKNHKKVKRESFEKDRQHLYNYLSPKELADMFDVIEEDNENMKDYLGIESIHAIEVFDSRGIPTVEVEVVTEGGFSRKSNGTVWRINREF